MDSEVDEDELWQESFADSAVSGCHLDKDNIPFSKLGHDRTIIHFDIDCFYAQVEILRNPDLKDKPVGVQQKNYVITSNYIAREQGLIKGMCVTEAKTKCPELVLVCGEDLINYRQMSYEISEFLLKYTPCVERLGFDENFVDVSEMVTWKINDGNYKSHFVGHIYGSNSLDYNTSPCSCGCELRLQIGSQIAADIREALLKELGITCCAGIGHNKLLAKLVAGTHKPTQQTSLQPHKVLELMSSLPEVLCIPGIGYRTSSRLQNLGISTVKDLQSCDRKILKQEFGFLTAQMLTQLCFGVDDSPVVKYTLPQTMSDEDAFKCCNDIKDAELRMKDLLTSLLKRVVEDGRIPQTIRLTIRRVIHKRHRESRQCSVPGHIFKKFHKMNSVDAVCDCLMPILLNLFFKIVDISKPFHLTLISICFAKFVKLNEGQGKISSFFTNGSCLRLVRKDDDQDISLNINLTNARSEFSGTIAGASSSESKSQSISKDANFSENKSQSISKVIGEEKTLTYFFSHVSSASGTDMTKVKNTDTVTESNSSNGLASNSDMSGRVSLMDKSPSDLECTGLSLGDTPHLTALVKELLVSSRNQDARKSNSVTLSQHTDMCLQLASAQNSLQALLPKAVDAQTIAELPCSIQKEVLLQYGVLMEDLPEGKRFSILRDKIITRSKTSSSETKKTKNPKLSPKGKGASKRKTQHSENMGCVSKSRKLLLFADQMLTSDKSSCKDLQKSICTSSGIHEMSQELRSCGSNGDKTHSVSNDDFLPDQDVSHKLSPTEFVFKCSNNNKQLTDSDTGNQHLLYEEKLRVSHLEKMKSTSKSYRVLSKEKGEDEESTFLLEISLKQDAPDKLSCLADDLQGRVPENFSNLTDNTSLTEQTDVHSQVPQVYAFKQQNLVQTSEQSSTSQINDNPSGGSSPTSCKKQKFHKLLPSDIDSEVFSSLPRNIQGEIMAHIMMGTSSTVTQDHAGKDTRSPSYKNTKKSFRKNNNQNTLLTYFKKK